MGQEAEAWNQFKAASKKHKHLKQASVAVQLKAYCELHNLGYTEIGEYHLRVFNEETIMDIYPQKNKYFNITTKKRGKYMDILAFITSVFKLAVRYESCYLN